MGDNSRVGANAVVLSEVEPNTTVVGVPGRAVKKGDTKLSAAFELDQIHIPDPISQELCKLMARIEKIEKIQDIEVSEADRSTILRCVGTDNCCRDEGHPEGK